MNKTIVKKLEKQVGMGRRETVLPIFKGPEAKTFTVRYGYWGGDSPHQTREEVYPIDRYEEVIENLKKENLFHGIDSIDFGEDADE